MGNIQLLGMAEYPFHITDEELLQALGRTTANFNAMEECLKMFIALLTSGRKTKIGFIVASELRFKSKTAALLSLYKERIDNVGKIEIMQTILNNISKLEKRRNIFTHSFYNKDIFSIENKFFRENPKSNIETGFDTNTAPVSAKELNNFADEIESLGISLLNILQEYLRDTDPRNTKKDQ